MKKARQIKKWGLRWVSINYLDGRTEHMMWEGGQPLIFQTRREARNHAEKRYGYIKRASDLKAMPFGWRFPQAVRIEVILRPL